MAALANQVRKIVLELFPEWKPLKRLKISCSPNSVCVQLITGVLSHEAEAVFDLTGTLRCSDAVGNRNVPKLVEALTKGLNKTVTVKLGPHFDHRQRCEYVYFEVT